MVASLPLESWQSLHQELRGIAKRRSALDADEARCLREAHALQLWRKLGYVHMAEYLERELGYGPQVGAERMRVARELGALPRLEASLADGTLSYSTVRELTRVATCETEQAWIDQARGKTVREIEAMVAGRKRGDRPDDPTTPELVHRVLRLEVTPAVFALFRQAQTAMAEEHGGRLDDSALLEVLCRRALEGTGSSERPAHQIAFTVCESCRRGWQNGGGREIEVGPAVLDRACCDAEWLGSLEAEHPPRVTATVTPRIRRQVLARDHQRCTVPGCRSARNLDLHHVQYQRDGGNHELWNITTVCTGHHLQLHDGALAISGKAPHDLVFTWRVPPADGQEREPRPVQPTAAPAPSGQGALVDCAGHPHESTISREPDARHAGPTAAEARESPACASVGRGGPIDASRIDRGDRDPQAGDPRIIELHGAAEALDHRAGEALEHKALDRAGRPHDEHPHVTNSREALDREAGPHEEHLHVTNARKVRDREARPHGEEYFQVTGSREARDREARPHEEHFQVTGSHEARDHEACPREARAHEARPHEACDHEARLGAVLDDEASEALITAGYSRRVARAAVVSGRLHVGGATTLEPLIRAALRCCARRGS